MITKVVARSPAEPAPDEFAEWVEPHLGRIALIASRLGAPGLRDDIVQEALTRAWRKRSQFDERRGNASAWLCAITANVARSSWRRTVSGSARAVAAPTVDVDAAIDLGLAIRRLPQRQRLAVECYYAIGLNTAEAAAVMGCSEGTVKSTLHDARENLRQFLGYSERAGAHGRS